MGLSIHPPTDIILRLDKLDFVSHVLKEMSFDQTLKPSMVGNTYESAAKNSRPSPQWIRHTDMSYMQGLPTVWTGENLTCQLALRHIQDIPEKQIVLRLSHFALGV